MLVKDHFCIACSMYCFTPEEKQPSLLLDLVFALYSRGENLCSLIRTLSDETSFFVYVMHAKNVMDLKVIRRRNCIKEIVKLATNWQSSIRA